MVSLKEEVLHIEEYIELEKIRFQDTLKVVLESHAINGKERIAPMILIPFVENAFKHGAIVNGYLEIEIQVSTEKQQLNFKIRNTILDDQETMEKGGIGLQNIKKRLELNYANNYVLKNSFEKGWYVVELQVFKLDL